MKKLIISADDFGLTKGINEGIIKAFRGGIVKSASIMPVGLAYDNAVRLAKENLGLDIGIHLCLTEERPILTKEEIPTLLERNGGFLKSHVAFIRRYLLGKVRIEEIRKELDAQIRKVIDSGMNISHIDSHGYIHLLPSMSKIVMELAKRYNIPFVRYPYERLVNLRSKLSRRLIWFSVNTFCRFLRVDFDNKSTWRADYFYGFLNSGHLSKKCLTQILKTVANGVTEIVCHPGVYDEETKRYDRWGYEWDKELRALTSPDIKEIIRDLDIELVSFKDIL
jgi:hopanoid biosynthesis associated protein HpnK